MGGLTASLAHEVSQPISAASTCVRWLTRDDPDLGEAREAALAVVQNMKRAADIISRVRSISKKGESNRQLVDINELIREIIVLLRTEAHRYSRPGQGRLCAIAASHDEPHDEQRGCNEGG